MEKSQDGVEVMSWDFSHLTSVPWVKKRPAYAGLYGQPGSPALYGTCRKFRLPRPHGHASPMPPKTRYFLRKCAILLNKTRVEVPFLVSRLTTLNFRISRMTLATVAPPSEGPQTMAPSGY